MVFLQSLSSSHFLGLRLGSPPRPSPSPQSFPFATAAALRSAGAARPCPAPASLYEALGVPAGATRREIKVAYRRLALECHPDVGASADEFMRLHAAYSTLSDPDKRADYDRHLMAAAAAAAAALGSRPTTYSRSTSFPGARRRRTWETDQCW